MISNFKQLGGTFSAVWLALGAAGAWEGCMSTAVVRNLVSNISVTSTKAVKGMAGEQAPDKSLQGYGEHCWTCASWASQGNLGLSKYHAPWSPEKPDFTVVAHHASPSPVVPPPAAPALRSQNPPAGPELLRPGFLFSPYVCEQAWRSEPAGTKAV